MKLTLALIFSVVFIFLVISNISAQCNKSQININTATRENLDKLYGIGLSKADAIINSRPFNSIEDLMKVNGIKNKTFNKIKLQGLVCVNNTKISRITSQNKVLNQTDIQDKNQDNNFKEDNEQIISYEKFDNYKTIKKPVTSQVINLNPKDIKTNKNALSSERNAVYGFIAFSVLLGFLFLVKKLKKHKTEFEK